MDASCLRYRLTEAQRREFEETGLLVIEGALSRERVAALTENVDRIYARQLEAGHDGTKPLFYPNFIPEDPLFAELVDEERTLPLVSMTSARVIGRSVSLLK